MATNQQENETNSEGRTRKTNMLGNLKQYIKEFEIELEEGKYQRNISKAWNDWIENFEICLEIEEVEQSKWIKIMKLLGGRELRQKITAIEEEEDQEYGEIKEKLQEHFQDKRSINAIRHEFFNTKPGKEESTREYAERCKRMAKECEFDKFSKKDAVLLNICQYTKHDKIRNEILVKELTLEETVKYGTSLEMANREGEKMKSKMENEEEEVQVIRKPGIYSKKYKQLKEQNKQECGRCGRSQPHECRAINQKCHKCQLKGHFAIKCKTKKINELQERSFYQESTDEEETEEI